MNVVRNWFNC